MSLIEESNYWHTFRDNSCLLKVQGGVLGESDIYLAQSGVMDVCLKNHTPTVIHEIVSKKHTPPASEP